MAVIEKKVLRPSGEVVMDWVGVRPENVHPLAVVFNLLSDQGNMGYPLVTATYSDGSTVLLRRAEG